jgi:hypothetical protein
MYLGWWFVQNNNQRGFVPGAYLELLDTAVDTNDSGITETSLSEYIHAKSRNVHRFMYSRVNLLVI